MVTTTLDMVMRRSAITDSVAFRCCGIPDMTMPVKNTFINFELPSSSPVRPMRSATCPPYFPRGKSLADTPCWEGATQVLCHAMAPKMDTREEFVSTTASSFNTPASSPRFGSALSQGTCTPPVCASEDQRRGADSHDDVTISGEWSQVPAKRYKKLQRTQRATRESIALARRSDSHVASSRPVQMQNRLQGRAKKSIYVQKHEIGIKDDSAFQVVRRLLGRGGENLKHISAESHGATLWICGDGSRRTEGARDREPLGPLSICASATSQASLDEASALIQDLLNATRDEYATFLSSEAPAPSAASAGQTGSFAGSFLVGIEEDRTFRVVKRLVGKGGRNMKRIEASSDGASVRLVGRRGLQQDGVEGPLEVRVSAATRASFDAAVRLVRALLKRVQEEYTEFCNFSGHLAMGSKRADEADQDV